MNKCSKALPYIKANLRNVAPQKVAFDDEPVIRNLNNGLLVTYLVDHGNYFEYVQNRDLKAEALTEGMLFQIGLQNLKGLVDRKLSVQPYGHVFATFLDGNHESSLLLMDELWEKTFKEYAPSGFVVAVPARDVLAFCDSQSVEGIGELRNIVNRAEDGKLDHVITSSLFYRKGYEWVRYDH
jgi:uncharacterized protein YtpQ (UPF0354 family)